MTEPRDDTLRDAIEDAQQKAEADQRWTSHKDLHELAAKLRNEEHVLRWTAHQRDHDRLQAVLEETERRLADRVASEFSSHAREHGLNRDQHSKEHSLEATARDKAESAVNQRLEGMNEVRAQLKDQALTFARVEVVQALTDRVIAIEKLDIKGEGRSLGQGAVIATIVAAVGFAATLLGLIVVLANVLTSPS